MKYSLALLTLALSLVTSSSWASSEAQGEAVTAGGPRLSPFECYGRYESATGNRTMSQIRVELEKKLDQLAEEGEPATVRAMKSCVIARLKQRLGDTDAGEWFEKSIELDPNEPGYELFFGMYWSGARGARAPVLEEAETHFYRALDKLEALEKSGKAAEYHAVVREWTEKRLLVLYQQDGQPLLPWKAYEYDGSGRSAIGAFASVRALISKDTRDFFYNSESRTFTGERLFAESDVRAARALTPREIWDLARAPLRTQLDGRLRLRHNFVGALDLLYSRQTAEAAQIESFYNPTSNFVDVGVQQLGAGYERVFPLYPLFDFRLAGSYRRVERRGVMEFLPNRTETFDMVEVKPSFSRFIGSDKLTLDLVYVRMDISDLPGGVPEQAMRDKIIRGGKLEYALYSPVTFPAFPFGSAEPFRSATRGWSFYVGAVQDDETYGLRRVTRRDLYAGTRFDGPDRWAAQLQGTYYQSRTTVIDPNEAEPVERTDTRQNFSSAKASLILQARGIDEQALPGIAPSAAGFSPDMLNFVVPLHFEAATEGPNDYDNFRGGAEVWFKVFQKGIGGTAFLLTAGYDAQYFYNIDKLMHLVSGGVRMGWGDL